MVDYKQPMKKLCLIYVRVSSEKQVDGYSLDSQEELCTKRAVQEGFEVIKIYREEGLSAKTTERPLLQEMLTYCLSKKNNISAIFIYSLSRLNRNTENHLMIQGLLSKAGVQLISLTEPTDPSPTGRFIETIFAATAQMENEMRAQNVANSLKKRFFEGYITSKPPVGYLMQRTNGKSQAVKDPELFHVIKNLWFKVANEGYSLLDCANELNRQGIVSTHQRNFKKFTPKAMTRVFSNRFYIGILISEKYGEAVGRHEPMIDNTVFYRVRDIITGRKPKRNGYADVREDFKLRKILRCEFCDRFMTSSYVQGRSKKYPKYYCQSRGLHPSVSYDRDFVEEKFKVLLQSITYDQDWLVWYTEFIKEKYHTQYDESIRTRKLIEVTIEELKAAKKIARQKNVKGIYTDDEYLEMRKDYDVDITVKEGLLAEKRMMEMDIDIILDFIVYYLSRLDQVWLDASPEGRVAIAGSIFPNGVVFSKNQFRTATLGFGYEAVRQARNTPMASGEPGGIRTRDQELKRLLLYR